MESSSYSFLDLPGELRMIVYQHLLLKPTSIDLDSIPVQRCTRIEGEESKERLHPNIISTCRAVFLEAITVLYGQNDFHLSYGSRLQTHTQLNIRNKFGRYRSFLRHVTLIEPGLQSSFAMMSRIAVRRAYDSLLCVEIHALKSKQEVMSFISHLTFWLNFMAPKHIYVKVHSMCGCHIDVVQTLNLASTFFKLAHAVHRPLYNKTGASRLMNGLLIKRTAPPVIEA